MHESDSVPPAKGFQVSVEHDIDCRKTISRATMFVPMPLRISLQASNTLLKASTLAHQRAACRAYLWLSPKGRWTQFYNRFFQ